MSLSKAQYALPDNRHCYYIFCLFLISIDKSLDATCEMDFSLMSKILPSMSKGPERQKEDGDLFSLIS